MSAKRQKKQCYLCGRTDKLTSDHLPPKGFFNKPYPPNLITVPCCYKCNNGWSKEDEFVRAILALSDIGRSQAGNEVFYGSVLRRLRENNQPLLEWLLSRMTDVVVQSDEGVPLELTRFDFTPDMLDRFNKYFERMTKGFIRHFHPDVDYSGATFVVHFVDDRRKLEEMRPLLKQLRYDEKGAEVFRLGHSVTETGAGGFFHYQFYGATEVVAYFSDRPLCA